MNLRFVSSALVAGLLLSTPAFAVAPASAPIDLSTLKLSADVAAETVEVNLNAALLSVAARITEGKDAEVSQLLRDLQLVQVRVLKQGDQAGESALAQVEAMRSKLNQAGWQKAVSVRDTKGGNVDVHLNLRGDEAIEGLVVTILNGKSEVVLVNIVGNIRPEQLAKLGTRLNIEPLQQLHLGQPCAPAAPLVPVVPAVPVAPSAVSTEVKS